MFHTCNFKSAAFDEWMHATNQLHLAHHLELKRPRSSYLPLQVNAFPQDHFLLYIDDEAGLCGSASITTLPYGLEIESQVIPEGTWVLRGVFFHIKQGHPLQEQFDRFVRIVKQFHRGLFEHVWQLAKQSDHQFALSFQNDLEAHEDLEFYGSFTFSKELVEQEGEISVAVGVIPITQQSYDTFQLGEQS